VGFARDEAVGQVLAEVLHILQATPHQALDGEDGVQRIFKGGVTGGTPDLDPVGMVANGRRDDHVALGIGQGLGDTASDGGDKGIGGAEVDAHGQATLVRLGAQSGFGDLQ